MNHGLFGRPFQRWPKFHFANAGGRCKRVLMRPGKQDGKRRRADINIRAGL
jgi:hypothetical protein